MNALITNIQGYSIHDGPGIRTVVFFKGCPLSCRWCANPECISPKAQVGFIESLCKHCGKCFEACTENALVPADAERRVDDSRCTACGKCAQACYYKAMVLYGREMSVKEVFEAVRRDKMFYDTSGGGVTVSGGEPLLQAEFVKELFELLKGEGIGTCVETCGFVNPVNLQMVLPLADHLLFDLKLMDSDLHRKYTGQPNELILKNAALAAESDVNILFRVPLIPTINDSEENIRKTAEFVKALRSGAEIQLMPYHRLGDSKYQALNMPNTLRNLQVMEPERLEAVRRLYLEHGVKCSVSR
jgi:pyruvate formate lyase activating enzyme